MISGGASGSGKALPGGRGALHGRSPLSIQRLMLGMSGDQMADRLGVTRATVGNWERGRSWPRSSDLLARAARAYGVTIERFVQASGRFV